MIKPQNFDLNLTFSQCSVRLEPLGKDVLITIRGGERRHIGSVVLSIPRPSLRGDGSTSATSSILNVTGHKDEYICRLLAENVAASLNTNVVCIGGFHVDNISQNQIDELLTEIRKLGNHTKLK